MAESSSHDGPDSVELEIAVYTLMSASIIGGVINLYQLLLFIQQKKQRFVASRKPTAIIIYCFICLITSFILAPLLFYYESMASSNGEIIEFYVEFFEEFCTIILLSIIIYRSWLLYYDYKFAEASINQNWKGIINTNSIWNDDESIFWLKYRKSFGNTRIMFIIFFIFIMIATVGLIVLAVFISIQDLANRTFHYFTICGLGIPFILFMVYILYKMHRNVAVTEDTFYIQSEIRYLSTFIILRMIALTIDSFINDNHMLYFTVEVITTFAGVCIQTSWVLYKLNKEHRENEVISNLNIDKIGLENVLLHKDAFHLFLRHCIDEMSVENLLFLVETAQMKAILNMKYNINKEKTCSILQSDKFVRVSSVNFSKYLTDDKYIDHGRDKVTFTSTKQENAYNMFQTAILNIKWIPITMHSDPVTMDSPSSSKIRLQAIHLSGSESGNREGDIRQIDKAERTPFEYGRYLYMKYIDDDSDLMINIPHKMRNALVDVFGSGHNKNDDKVQYDMTYLYHVFDETFHNIWMLLLRDTLSRFKATEKFHKLDLTK